LVVRRAKVLYIKVKNSSDNSLKKDLSIDTTGTPAFFSFHNASKARSEVAFNQGTKIRKANFRKMLSSGAISEHDNQVFCNACYRSSIFFYVPIALVLECSILTYFISRDRCSGF